MQAMRVGGILIIVGILGFVFSTIMGASFGGDAGGTDAAWAFATLIFGGLGILGVLALLLGGLAALVKGKG